MYPKVLHDQQFYTTNVLFSFRQPQAFEVNLRDSLLLEGFDYTIVLEFNIAHSCVWQFACVHGLPRG